MEDYQHGMAGFTRYRRGICRLIAGCQSELVRRLRALGPPNPLMVRRAHHDRLTLVIIDNHTTPITTMKRLLITLLLNTCLAISALAQNAKVTFTVAHYKGYISIMDPSAPYRTGGRMAAVVSLTPQHTGTYVTGTMQQPMFIKVFFMSNETYHVAYLWLSPGDDLTYQIDFAKTPYAITVGGRGSNNNQPEIFALANFDTQPYRENNSPRGLISALNKQGQLNKLVLANYIKRYNPSPAFIKASRQNLAYFAPSLYYEFHHNYHHDNTNPKLDKWQLIEDSLLATVKLNNDEALAACNYNRLINEYMLREKERLMMQQMENPVSFFREWYHTTPAKGKPLYESERQNLFVEKVLNKHFKGKTAEYLYSKMFMESLIEHNPTNLGEMYARFKQKYPRSQYISWYDAPVNDVVKKQNRGLNNNMIFPPNNGSTINTWKEVLAMMKGKTVLVDMWGTWCSPCREELAENSAPLREHFKGKPVVFLYIDSFDLKNEKLWKNLIAYLHLEGTHILANDILNRDIVSKLHFSGYPSYFLIKKDGTYKMTKTQYRVDRNAMIKEIEAAM